MKPTVWLLSFESSIVRKVGGLGEVPPNIALHLPRHGYEAYVVMPGHSAMRGGEPFAETVIDGVEITYHIVEGPPRHIVVEGGVLSDPRVYHPEVLDAKAILFAKAVAWLSMHHAELGLDAPIVIHGNDWHSVPAMIAAKKVLGEKERGPASVYHIHLLSRKRVDEGYLAAAGLRCGDTVATPGGVKDICRLLREAGGYMDRLGALVSEKLVTVSRHYLYMVLGILGDKGLAERSGVIYNGTTWVFEDIVEEARGYVDAEPSIASMKKWGRVLRRLLLTKLLPETVVETEEWVLDTIRGRNAVLSPNAAPKPFTGDGPLVIMTGRLVGQKGFHVLIRGFEDLVSFIPDIRVLLIVIPVWGSHGLLEELLDLVEIYPENLRVVPGKMHGLYRVAHLAADAMAAPSIYEPFGIMAVEAMASATPVAASCTGGLAETVLDIRRHGVMGTGMHHRPGWTTELVETLASLTLMMEAGYHEPYTRRWNSIVESIPVEDAAQLLLDNPRAPWLIRESCIRRAREYTWDRAAATAAEIYGSITRVVQETGGHG